MGKRGGKSAKIASVRSDLADRLEREYRLQPHLASQYAGQVAEAAGGDLGRCSGKWLRNATEIPSGYVCYMLRALEDHLSGSPVNVSVGDKRGAPGETAPAAVGTGLHSMAMVAPREAAVQAAATNEAATKAAAAGEAAARTAATYEAAVNTAAADEAAAKAAAADEAAAKATATAEDNTTTRGISQSLPSQGAASEANSVTAHFLALLEGQGCMSASTQRVKCGFEVQWEMSVAAALSDMQSEFSLSCVSLKFREMCDMGQVLFLREVKTKAVRILAHKKKKLKEKKTKKAK
jgi:hypothetical protein